MSEGHTYEKVAIDVDPDPLASFDEYERLVSTAFDELTPKLSLSPVESAHMRRMRDADLLINEAKAQSGRNYRSGMLQFGFLVLFFAMPIIACLSMALASLPDCRDDTDPECQWQQPGYYASLALISLIAACMLVMIVLGALFAVIGESYRANSAPYFEAHKLRRDAERHREAIEAARRPPAARKAQGEENEN